MGSLRPAAPIQPFHRSDGTQTELLVLLTQSLQVGWSGDLEVVTESEWEKAGAQSTAETWASGSRSHPAGCTLEG